MLHDLRPAASYRAKLRDLFKEIALRNEIKGKSRRKLIDGHARLEHLLDVDDAVGERESGLLQRRGASFRHMITGDVDGIVAPHVLSAVRYAIANDAYRRRNRIDELLLRHIFL